MISWMGWPTVSVMVLGLNCSSVNTTVSVCVCCCAETGETLSTPAIATTGKQRSIRRQLEKIANMITSSSLHATDPLWRADVKTSCVVVAGLCLLCAMESYPRATSSACVRGSLHSVTWQVAHDEESVVGSPQV